ncbi:MAG: DHH family phosphoesterase [Planctomycetota bacterium]|jgi:phosphoesterase RecJ-like protein
MIENLSEIAARVKERVDAGKKFLITAHVNLDGDAIGSALALAHVLEKQGKTANIVCDSMVPDCFKFLTEIGNIKHPPENLEERYDAIFYLDVGNRHRIGSVKEFIDGSVPEINIDHHASNGGFGAVDVLDHEASAVGEILADLFAALGWELDEVSATQLFTAIYTDTGRFSFANTSPHTFEVAARLAEHGVDIENIYRRIYQSTSRGITALRGRLYNGMDFAAGGKIGYIHITRADFSETGTSPLDTQQFADIPRAVEGVEVSAYFREEDDGKYKVSFRANTDFDLNKFAARFNGGGHPKAAGCTIFEGWPKVRDLIIGELKKEMGIE